MIQAPTVGTAPRSLAVDDNVGAAAVYAPSDRGFPADGIVAIGPLSEAHLLVAELDPAPGHHDWASAGHLAGDVVCTRLRTA